VVLYRYLEGPSHPRHLEGDFSKRLEPQPGMKLVYARTNIGLRPRPGQETRRSVYSDDVSVFLNGKILYPRSQRPGLPRSTLSRARESGKRRRLFALEKVERNSCMALSELGGGWGFICRLLDMEN